MIAAVHAHVYVCTRRPEDTLCFETGSLIGLELLDKTSLLASELWEPACLCCPRVEITSTGHHAWPLRMDSWNQTQVLKLVRQALHQLSHLPSPWPEFSATSCRGFQG